MFNRNGRPHRTQRQMVVVIETVVADIGVKNHLSRDVESVSARRTVAIVGHFYVDDDVRLFKVCAAAVGMDANNDHGEHLSGRTEVERVDPSNLLSGFGKIEMEMIRRWMGSSSSKGV
ncbi:hypothetical protein PM082_003911 [Marasmius tenuissimus]|nr:hypothetical protein PM082_003911 [Marasmius tenuissimus]